MVGSRQRTRWIAPACGGSLVVALSAAAICSLAVVPKAARAESSGVIHACFARSDLRELRYLPTGRCPPNQFELYWSRRGPSGPPGPPGGKGAKGDPGTPGRVLIVKPPPRHPADDTIWAWIGEAVPAATNSLLLVGLAALILGMILALLGVGVRRAFRDRPLPKRGSLTVAPSVGRARSPDPRV